MTSKHLPFPVLFADEAAALVSDGDTVAFSAFTPAGSVKAVPRALAARARAATERGERLRIKLMTGASTDPAIDDALAEADAIAWRTPFQSSKPLRQRINRQEVEFVDMHLSHLPQMLEFGFVGDLDLAVIEAAEVTRDGRVYLTNSVGASPSFLRHAKRVVIELNAQANHRMPEMHDIAVLPPPPKRSPIPILDSMGKIGTPFASVDPSKIVGVVHTDEPDTPVAFSPTDDVSLRIADHVTEFLSAELAAGRIPAEFLPLQAGVGNVSNAVMAKLGSDPRIPPFYMYSEVYQDSLVDLMRRGTLLGASATGLTLSAEKLDELRDDMDFFVPRVVLRPQEISNNPGVIRRLGVISINTVVEFDVFGYANSTHVCGTKLINGLGGSGDFVRNAYLSILVSPSTARGDKISAVVPMVSHVDHTDHSVQIVVTEQGLADLRGIGPRERARRVIDNCAHPRFRDALHRYVEQAPVGHMPHNLATCHEFHRRFVETGDMLG